VILTAGRLAAVCSLGLAIAALLASASGSALPRGASSAPQAALAPAKLKGVSRARTVKGRRLSIRRPASVVPGDLLVAGIGVRLASGRGIRPPAGW
jgi:hypothetical protein